MSLRMALVAATEAEQALGRFHMLAIVENVETGDDRIYTNITVPPGDLWLPVTAQDWQDVSHLNAVLVGHIDTIEKRGNEVHAWGPYLTAPEGEAARLIPMVKRGELRGVSADMDDLEVEVLVPADQAPPEGEEAAAAAEPVRETIDGQEYVVIPLPQPKARVTEARLRGATILPFPAFIECFVEDDSGAELALVASAAGRLAHHRLTGAVLDLPNAVTAAGHEDTGTTVLELPSEGDWTFPDFPPEAWFFVEEPPGPMPLTILASGQVFGHLALWGECHVASSGECIQAPPSRCGYARFHVGEVPTAEGSRVDVGHLTFHTGHAKGDLTPDATRAHYDHTGTVAADVRVIDGQYGPWMAGAMRPGMTRAQVREVMSAPPSGDWRRFGPHLELVAALSVNVPGFNVRRDQAYAKVRRDGAPLVASLILSHPAPDDPPQSVVASLVASLTGRPAREELDPELAELVREALAESIGRGSAVRRAELYAAVHGGS